MSAKIVCFDIDIAVMSFYSLVYASSAVRPFSEAELKNLLQVARTNNERLGVSGILLYSDGNFLQVLEGEESVVESLFSRIMQDVRHEGGLRLLTREDTQRNFEGWSMGFKRLHPEEACEALPGFNDLLNREPGPHLEMRSRVAATIWSLLMSFRQVVKL